MRVVIIGAGAAGVFTAYRLHETYGDAFEIVLIEKGDRIGGNAFSTSLEFGGRRYSIDCGAQFFYKKPQPSYVKLLGDLGVRRTPPGFETRATGITLWDRQTGNRAVWIPVAPRGVSALPAARLVAHDRLRDLPRLRVSPRSQPSRQLDPQR